MIIFQQIDCPLCEGEIVVIIENNKITSHGVCPNCDQAFSAERLQFVQDCGAMEEEFMYQNQNDVLLDTVDIELANFYHQLKEKGVEL